MESAATLSSKNPSFFWRTFAPGICLFAAWLYACVKAGTQAMHAGLGQYALAISVAAGAILMVVASLIYHSITQREPLCWRIKTRDWLVGSVAVVAIYLGSYTCNKILGIPRERMMETLFSGHSTLSAATLVAIIIIAAPIGEELAIRYFLLGAFLKKTTPAWKWGAILGSASIFMLLHVFQYQYFTTHITIFALGVLMGIMRLRTGGLILPITLHAQAGATALILNNFY